jgi:hypothetical protein
LEGVLAFWAQFMTEGSKRGSYDLLEPIALIVTLAAIGAVLYPTLRLLQRRVRGDVRRRRAGRAARRSRQHAETRARAMMSELCPHGWSCRITLYEGPPPEGEPPPKGRVALDWAELRDDSGSPAVMRRVWAASIADALDAMLADRRTDEALEQIEMRATLEGADWPDV